jgi:ubiquitin-protein ligase
MSSRTTRILLKEKNKIIELKTWGIEFIESKCILEWNLYLSGPLNTPWERARFKIIIHFTQSFPETPPYIFFQTVPFHPNIDIATGRPCVGFMEQSFWRRDIDMGQVLIHLQVVNFKQNLLAEPELEDAVNPEAADMFLKSPKLYFQLARDAVVASNRLERGVSIFDLPIEDFSIPSIDDNSKATEQPPIKILAFENYHQTWLKTATSLESRFELKRPINAVDLLKFKTQNTRFSKQELKAILAEYQ